MSVVTDLKSELPVTSLCDALDVSRASYYRSATPAEAGPLVAPEPQHPRPSPPRTLSDKERAAVLDALHSERFIDLAPREIFAILLDEQRYLCSPRTMYRILEQNAQIRERRDQLRHPSYSKPELLATAPNQVWSWDITKLLGPIKYTYFQLYVVLDLFSRYVVAWMVHHSESASLAKRLFEAAAERQGIVPGQLTVHADRGTSMRSKALAQLFDDLQVQRSHSRPQVSNDNPYSESQFKTMKYDPTFPDRFGSIQDARAFCRTFFDWYNNQHRHAGIAFLTPSVVHHGRSTDAIEQRRVVLDAAFRAHPERFVKARPRPTPLPTAVYINPPKENPLLTIPSVQ